ncbi:hypothetical protein K6119_09445 [Paracrocinitomix mangrovi]|uniref:hypothetical protein n=1 Tax=Paracrocinitomix mangrovi TaxID=2862509 RepID=UPI001C8EE91B|nr:hypothetical protein [Paracrocinitomix mangrovi]UKN03714.1 hypothetical protein K6119_09445 [Paracrocinitomix mangrovi]
MRIITTLTLSILLISCSNTTPITADEIVIEKTDKHPLLSDHGRILKTITTDGELIDEMEIYTDPGIGCKAYLFANGDDFTMIDCNGQWYAITKANGSIEKGDWNWMKEPPGDCISVYTRTASIQYKSTACDTFSLEGIYKFKDPG